MLVSIYPGLTWTLLMDDLILCFCSAEHIERTCDNVFQSDRVAVDPCRTAIFCQGSSAVLYFLSWTCQPKWGYLGFVGTYRQRHSRAKLHGCGRSVTWRGRATSERCWQRASWYFPALCCLRMVHCGERYASRRLNLDWSKGTLRCVVRNCDFALIRRTLPNNVLSVCFWACSIQIYNILRVRG